MFGWMVGPVNVVVFDAVEQSSVLGGPDGTAAR